MAKKRMTDPDEIERLSERVWHESHGKISSAESFNYYFETYLGGDLTKEQDTDLRSRVFTSIVIQHPKIDSQGKTTARFYDLLRQKKETAKKTKEKEGVTTYAVVGGKNYEFIGHIRERQVFARRDVYLSKKGVSYSIWRDRQGRFVKVPENVRQQFVFKK